MLHSKFASETLVLSAVLAASTWTSCLWTINNTFMLNTMNQVSTLYTVLFVSYDSLFKCLHFLLIASIQIYLFAQLVIYPVLYHIEGNTLVG